MDLLLTGSVSASCFEGLRPRQLTVGLFMCRTILALLISCVTTMVSGQQSSGALLENGSPGRR